MLISKFDLYNPEWLELVFDNRNKEYGAYDLRQHYARNMVMAMALTFSGIALLFGVGMIFHISPHQDNQRTIDVVHPVTIAPPPAEAIKKPDPPAPAKPLKAQPATPPVAITRDVPPIVVDDSKAQDPPKNSELNGAIGLVTSKGAPTTNAPVEAPPGPPAAPDPDKVYTPAGIDVMPMPVGGEAAWMKFLSRNLRYPQAAQEDGVSGRVYMSFIVEKDGSLSNISVERAAGHGFDEEAARVLKLAKAWKPGMQNGQAVRVKYIIPINFQFTDQP